MDQFEISVSAEYDHTSVRGNAMDSGDEQADRELENEIIARLDAGDVWAWCVVTVTVSCGDLSESDSLGGCCYTSEEDFRESSGYFDDMVSECKARLITQAHAVLAAAAAEAV